MSIDDLKRRENISSLNDLQLPYNYDGFKKVINRLETAILKKEKIIIYGDYDFDGISSTAILKRMFSSLSIDCGFFIPSRYHEGYGLNKNRINEFKNKNYQLIICVDNGISKIDEIKYANSLNMDVVIIDHHTISTELPPTPYIFHQQIDKFISYNCSAASLCFFVSSYFRKKFDEYDVVLAGLAVLSDVMPLVYNNLILLRNALFNINNYKANNLFELASSMIKAKTLTFDDLSTSIIAQINAPGRVRTDSLSTNNVCRFLLDDKVTLKTKKYILDINNAQNEKKEAIKKSNVLNSLVNEYCSVYLLDALTGLSGLFANLYMNKENKPIVIFSPLETDNEVLVGSIRVPNNYSLLPLIDNPKKYFISSGGHQNAMGLKIYKKDLLKFATDFTMFVSTSKNEVIKNYIEISIEELTYANYLIYKRFEPFSFGFEKPLFKVTTDLHNLRRISDKVSVINNDNLEGKITFFGDFKENKDDETIYEFIGELKLESYYNKKTFSLISNSYSKIE